MKLSLQRGAGEGGRILGVWSPFSLFLDGKFVGMSGKSPHFLKNYDFSEFSSLFTSDLQKSENFSCGSLDFGILLDIRS
jgi:hypothetical protein